jgi:hypothetical protein
MKRDIFSRLTSTLKTIIMPQTVTIQEISPLGTFLLFGDGGYVYVRKEMAQNRSGHFCIPVLFHMDTGT